MRVIEQIIEYLSSRGRHGLIPQGMRERLVEHGFIVEPRRKPANGHWTEEDFGEFDPYFDLPHDPFSTEPWPDDERRVELVVDERDAIQDELELAELRRRPNRQHSPGKRRRSGQAAPAVPGTLTVDALVARLAALQRPASPGLEQLLQVARAFDATATIQTAPGIVRAADADTLDRVLGGLLDGGSLSLGALWSVVRFRGHHDVADDEPRSGQAMRAYDTLLGAARHDESVLGYPWLLRHASVAWALDLERAQQAILRFVRRAYDQRPMELARWMRRGYEPAVYHALAILHSARSPRPEGVDRLLDETDVTLYAVDDEAEAGGQPASRHAPRRRFPDPPTRAAWPLAIALDPVQVAAFALWYFHEEAASRERTGWPGLKHRRAFMTSVLTCPPEWDA